MLYFKLVNSFRYLSISNCRSQTLIFFSTLTAVQNVQEVLRAGEFVWVLVSAYLSESNQVYRFLVLNNLSSECITVQ